MSKKFIWLLPFLAFLLLAGPVFAQDPAGDEPTDDEINDVARDLNCPTCAGINLEDCNTQTCFQWREQIGDLLAQGYSKQQVLDWYVDRYGEHVLQEPARRGAGLYVWLLPIAAVAAGLIWLGLVLKSWLAKKQVLPAVAAATPETTATEVNDDYLRQVEQDLKNL
jgi:cytochrome c-type biogenesis protein CcmH